MDGDQEAPLAVHGGGGGTSSAAVAAPLPPDKARVDAHPEAGATSPSTKNNVPATTTTAPFAATAATAYPSDADPETVGMPIEGDDVAFDAAGFSGGECVSLLACCRRNLCVWPSYVASLPFDRSDSTRTRLSSFLPLPFLSLSAHSFHRRSRQAQSHTVFVCAVVASPVGSEHNEEGAHDGR